MPIPAPVLVGCWFFALKAADKPASRNLWAPRDLDTVSIRNRRTAIRRRLSDSRDRFLKICRPAVKGRKRFHADGNADCASYPIRAEGGIFGVAAFANNDLPETLMARMDNALYRAKATGRNRVELSTPPAAASPSLQPTV